MSEHALKYENNFFFKENCSEKLFFAFKITYYCCFDLIENLDFQYFLQKSFITSTTDCVFCNQIGKVIV